MTAGVGNIGIIGRGNVGQALERGFKAAGREVRVTGKAPNEVRDIGQWADLIVLAVPHAERQNALRELGDAVHGKPLLDVTNTLDKDMGFKGSLTRSGAEELQDLARQAHVVKGFNTVFASHMDKGAIGDEPLTLFLASDHDDAKQAVRDLGEAIGFDVVDAGPLEHARWLETLGYLNITLAFKANLGGNSGFHYIHDGGRAGRGQRPAKGQVREDKAGKAQPVQATPRSH